MRKSIWILVSVLLLAAAVAGCSASAPGASESAPSESAGEQAANVWMVTKEAPVTDGQGNVVGTAFPGFAVSLQNEKDGMVTFTISEMDEKGQNVKTEKIFSINAEYMQKEYTEPKAVIMMISADMIKLNPGGSLYSEAGEKLITFNDGVGPFFYIQKTDNGYMFTLDFNVVYAPEADTTFIKLS